LLGRRLKDLREARGYTQEELANLVDVALIQVYRWETDKRDPPAETLARLARVLGTTTDYLVGLENAPRERSREQDLSPDERLLLDAYRTGRLEDVLRVVLDRPRGNVSDQTNVATP